VSRVVGVPTVPGPSWATTSATRRRMQSQRRRDTAPELGLRSVLHGRGFRYRLHLPIVPGAPLRRVDIVFRKARVAVFVDGCFWHGCEKHADTPPTANRWYWPDKIAANRARDRDTDQRLMACGWTVIRVWEHESPTTAADRIGEVVRARAS
jgi:DNA mismatch endonuclease (patch repair protein)